MRRQRSLRSSWAALSVTVLFGCQSEDGASSGTIERYDSAGASVVVGKFSGPPELEVARQSLDELVGGDDSPIANLRDLAWLSSTRFAFVDSDLVVQVFDTETGASTRTGGRGEGPSEFADVLWVSRLPDGDAAVFDPMSLSLTEVEAGGDVTGRTRYSSSGEAGAVDWRGVLSGALVGVSLLPVRSVLEEGGADPWGASDVWMASPDRGARKVASLVLTRCRPEPVDRCSPDPDVLSGSIDVVGDRVALSPLHRREVRLISLDGALHTIIREREPGVGYQRLFGDAQSRVWFGHAGSQEWHRYDPVDGSVESLRLPAEFRLFDVWEDLALGLVVDTLGVQRIAVGRIERQG